MRFLRIRSLALLLVIALATTPAGAAECDSTEPDSVQISWSTPCEDGSWLLDPETGCRMWDWHPAPEDTMTWSGICRAGLKEGAGVLQWFEHGRPIDRFEGTFRGNQRTGFGRYSWTPDDRYEGQYEGGLPHGRGTARIAGETFTGNWRQGCFGRAGKVVAIGVPLTSCLQTNAIAEGP